jgi:TRAP-type C4-dicarboxylate transport system substrate-binding protein
MNLRKFESLTPDQQKALLTAAHEAAVAQRKLNRDQESQDLAAIKAAGVQVTENIDKKEFAKIVLEPVKEEYVKKFGSDVVDAIQKLQ